MVGSCSSYDRIFMRSVSVNFPYIISLRLISLALFRVFRDRDIDLSVIDPSVLFLWRLAKVACSYS